MATKRKRENAMHFSLLFNVGSPQKGSPSDSEVIPISQIFPINNIEQLQISLNNASYFVFHCRLPQKEITSLSLGNPNLSIYPLNKVKLNVVPSPTLLSTLILPPFFSTNSLHSNKPNPVLGSPSVPLLFTFALTLNKL